MRLLRAGVALAFALVGATLAPARASLTELRCEPGDLVYTRIGETDRSARGHDSASGAVASLVDSGYHALQDEVVVPVATSGRKAMFVVFDGTRIAARWDVVRDGSWQVARFVACNDLLGGPAEDGAVDQEEPKKEGSEFYENKWTGDDLTIEWRFTEDFPGGPMRRMTVKAAEKWNALEEPMRFSFDPEAEDWEAYSPSSCPGNNDNVRNGIHWGPGAAGAFTIACTYTNADGSSSGRMHSFQIQFSSETSWYTGKKRPPWGYEDFLSYATHEFGHATGRIEGGDGSGHFRDASSKLCAPRAEVHHTMCQTAPNRTIYDRTLNWRDRGEFSSTY